MISGVGVNHHSVPLKEIFLQDLFQSLPAYKMASVLTRAAPVLSHFLGPWERGPRGWGSVGGDNGGRRKGEER